LQYVKAKYPQIKKLAYVSWDVGPTITDRLKVSIRKR